LRIFTDIVIKNLIYFRYLFQSVKLDQLVSTHDCTLAKRTFAMTYKAEHHLLQLGIGLALSPPPLEFLDVLLEMSLPPDEVEESNRLLSASDPVFFESPLQSLEPQMRVSEAKLVGKSD
jgi:hypothetical protein